MCQARMRRDKERIEELEEALKQSVKITTKCEMDVARQREELAKQNKLIHQVSRVTINRHTCMF